MLVDNETQDPSFEVQHGLSMYIETEQHKILFDLGQDDLFLLNAARLNIDLKEVDTVVISHGHYDHGGGLKPFLAMNQKAKIYIQPKALEAHYSWRDDHYHSIGLELEQVDVSRFVFTHQFFSIDDELTCFTTPSDPHKNQHKGLAIKTEDGFKSDPFEHEQSLWITSQDKTLLCTGCSHQGIAAICQQAHTHFKQDAQWVMGGFHVYNHRTHQSIDTLELYALSQQLMSFRSHFYTCHCTGLEAYQGLKNRLDDQVDYLYCGQSVIL